MLQSSGSRIPGGGRKPLLDTYEDLLLDHIVEKRVRKEKVSREWIANETRKLVSLPEFVASERWVSSFMKRNGLSLRKVTNLTTLDDNTLLSRATSYMKFLGTHIPSMNIDRTILMDETAVYFEDCRMHTVDEVGAHHVVLRSIGFSSMRITVILAVTASGRKLPPLLIWKGKQSAEIQKIGGCLVMTQEKAWVNQQLLLKWLQHVSPRFGRKGTTSCGTQCALTPARK